MAKNEIMLESVDRMLLYQVLQLVNSQLKMVDLNSLLSLKKVLIQLKRKQLMPMIY